MLTDHYYVLTYSHPNLINLLVILKKFIGCLHVGQLLARAILAYMLLVLAANKKQKEEIQMATLLVTFFPPVFVASVDFSLLQAHD